MKQFGGLPLRRASPSFQESVSPVYSKRKSRLLKFFSANTPNPKTTWEGVIQELLNTEMSTIGEEITIPLSLLMSFFSKPSWSNKLLQKKAADSFGDNYM